jgi:hypothetical protein
LALHDGKLVAERSADAAELRAALSPLQWPLDPAARDRQAAVVCLLSASDGWSDASRSAGGAFADEPKGETGLRSVKGE